MKSAQDISQSYAEYQALLYLREDAKKFGRAYEHSDCLKVDFACNGASGIWKSDSGASIKEATAKAYRDAIERSIKKVEKRFREAELPIE